jgi:hypothetical protein
MSNVETPWGGSDTTPPFTTGPSMAGEPAHGAAKGSIRVVAEAFAIGLAAAIPAGAILGWLLYGAMASDCHGDGWCELGAAIYGLGLGVLAGCVIYLVAGVATIRRHRRQGERLALSLLHACLPVALVILGQLASYLSSLIS